MSKEYDAIVIGAGLGGLSAAAVLAAQGQKVLVLEKHNVPGGSSTSFVRGRFEFETSLHELATIGSKENPGAVRQMLEGQLGLDVDWVCDMTETFRLLVPNEGIDADMPCGVREFSAKLAELVPGCEAAVGQMMQLGMEAVRAYEYIYSPEYNPEEMNERFPNYGRLAGHSITEVLDSIGMPKKAQNIIATYWCYLGAPADEHDFMTYMRMLFAYLLYGAGMPKLRSHELSMAFEQKIRDNGGDVWYNTPVDRILVKDGKAYGVEIDGSEYLAKNVVSNAYPNAVYGTMIDAAEVPSEAVKLVNSRKLGLSFVTVYLGMDCTAEELGVENYTTFMAPTSDSMEQRDSALNTHEYCGFVIMNCLNKAIPDCTPEGTCQLFFTTFYFGNGWDDVTEEEYEELKTETARKIIAQAEEYLHIDITPHIEEIVISAPPTFARYLNTPEGTPYGYQMNMLDSFAQRAAARKQEQFIDGLYFVGAATEYGDGYSSAMLSGASAAKMILAKEMQRGDMQR